MQSTTSFIDRIYDFNRDAGLLEAGYDDFLESSFQIEEALEGFDLTELCKVLDLPHVFTSKDISRMIVNTAGPNREDPFKAYTPLSDVDRLDKACDAIVFAIGSIAKLGLTPEQASRAIHIVMDANQAKLKNRQMDTAGKLIKSDNFVGPEPRLQELLDQRS